MLNFWKKVKLLFINVKNKMVSLFGKLKNSFCGFFKSLRNKISGFFESHKNSKIKENPLSKEKQKIKKSVGKKVGFAFLNFLDVIADLVFAAVIILILKPGLVPKFVGADKGSSASIYGLMDVWEFLLKYKDNLSFFLIVVLTAYFIFKLVFSFIYVRGLQRVSCAMIVVLSIVLILLLLSNICFFLLFYFLLYITFQISCGIEPKCAIFKLFAVIVLDIALYFELHLIFIEDIKEMLLAIVNCLKI